MRRIGPLLVGGVAMDEEKQGKGFPNQTTIHNDQNIMSGNVSSGGISIQGSNAKVTIQQTSGLDAEDVTALFEKIYQHIEARPADPNVDKEEIVESVKKIQEETSKGEQANETKLTRWINYLNKIAPDIVDVALASLGGPVSGVTAVLKKIADRARQEPKPLS
jgi:hypothetical protein